MSEIITGDIMMSIKSVKPLEDFKLYLLFSNGEERIFDAKPLLEKPVYSPLKDVDLFKKVHIIYDYTIAWNEDIDMCPDSLYISSEFIKSN